MRKRVDFYYFKRKPIKSGNKYEEWRKVAELLNLSATERLRVEWIIFYYTQLKQNASLTTRHFGISRKTFYKWFNRFRESKENVGGLRDLSRRPISVRKWEVSSRIKALRRKYMYYGKKKLRILYRKAYNENISCWKIERVIRKHKLYPDKKKVEKIARKQARARVKPKKRIQELKKEKKLWFLVQIDTIVIYWNNIKRYIITAVDHASKFGYARMYENKGSKVAADFMYRLQYVINQSIENLQTDNGSGFTYYFNIVTKKLNVTRYFSRVKTPKDNPEAEKFNETLEYEWLYNGNLIFECAKFNKQLTKWLVEYNFNRPHETLNYLTPIEYFEKELVRVCNPTKVLPMWSAGTIFNVGLKVTMLVDLD